MPDDFAERIRAAGEAARAKAAGDSETTSFDDKTPAQRAEYTGNVAGNLSNTAITLLRTIADAFGWGSPWPERDTEGFTQRLRVNASGDRGKRNALFEVTVTSDDRSSLKLEVVCDYDNRTIHQGNALLGVRSFDADAARAWLETELEQCVAKLEQRAVDA